MSDTATAPAVAVPIVLLSGPSGSGKSTIVRELLSQSPVKLRLSVSATTRAPRVGEQNGREYYFLSPDEFHRLRDADEFIECCEVHSNGNWYGTLRSELQKAHEEQSWALLEIDVQGAQRVMEQYPDAVSIFLRTSSEAAYEKRLRDRATESEDALQQRLASARRELECAHGYHFQVINDDLQQAVQQIIEILTERERRRHA